MSDVTGGEVKASWTFLFQCCKWNPGLSLYMLGKGLPQATPWPLGFQKHPQDFSFSKDLLLWHTIFCLQILSVQTESFVDKSLLCLVDACRIPSHLSASIYLTFSLLPSVLTSRQRLESEICLIIRFFFFSLSFRKGAMGLLILCVELQPSGRNVYLRMSCRGVQRWRGTLGWCVHPTPTLMELNSYMSFWEVKTA